MTDGMYQTSGKGKRFGRWGEVLGVIYSCWDDPVRVSASAALKNGKKSGAFSERTSEGGNLKRGFHRAWARGLRNDE